MSTVCKSGCRLLVGCKTLPEHPVHITLGEATSTSATPKARGNRFMDFLSRMRADEEIRKAKYAGFLAPALRADESIER